MWRHAHIRISRDVAHAFEIVRDDNSSRLPRRVWQALFLPHKPTAMRPVHAHHPLPAFPVYSSAFLSSTQLVLGGGGGASRSGIKNRLVCTHTLFHNRTHPKVLATLRSQWKALYWAETWIRAGKRGGCSHEYGRPHRGNLWFVFSSRTMLNPNRVGLLPVVSIVLKKDLWRERTRTVARLPFQIQSEFAPSATRSVFD